MDVTVERTESNIQFGAYCIQVVAMEDGATYYYMQFGLKTPGLQLRGPAMRNIALCCDGTRGKYDTPDKNTNVVRLFEWLGQDGPDQISYYDPGVGTSSDARNLPVRWLDRLAESVSGMGITSDGINDNVTEAYRYLMDCHEPGDRMYLFGYSRGAHTVRVLAAMLHKCGLLTKGSMNLVPYMEDIYHKRGNDEIAVGFKRSFSRECRPHFIGVWDTVASIGWIRRKQFSNNRLNPDVAHACQVLALDERRHHFRVSVWDETGLPVGQTIEQVWFPGYHGDVGGQESDRRISDISLEWMLGHAESKELKLRPDWRESLNSDPSGDLERSDKLLWRLGAKDRIVPNGSRFHGSVIRRMEDLGKEYRPGNLPGSYVEVD